MEQVETLLRLSDSLEKHTIAVRRMIHQKPELAFEEYKTAGLVMQELRRMGIPYEESPVEPGIVAVIDSGKPGKLLMLRADMDALPIEEMEELPDACMALHVTSDQRGKFYVGVGPVTAFSDRCEIVVHGKAAHSSEPQEGVDAVYIAASIIVALNTLVPKNLSPMEHSTLNMGMISGGAALNVITDRVEMHGMMRNAEAQTRSVICLLYTSDAADE